MTVPNKFLTKSLQMFKAVLIILFFSNIVCQHACVVIDNHFVDYIVLDGNLSLGVTFPYAGDHGWSAIGFNKRGEKMNGASILMIYFNGSEPVLHEYYSHESGQIPKLVPIQSSYISSFSKSPTKFVIKRPLIDPNGYHNITNEIQSAFIAYNNEQTPSSSIQWEKHTTIIGFEINWFQYGKKFMK